MRMALATGLAMMLAGCSDPEPPANVVLANDGVPQPPRPRPRPDATGPGTALGLTYLQLEDADLIGASGQELAEVHEIDADTVGTIHGLVIKLKGGATPGRMVRIPMQGLSIVPAGDAAWNLRTTATGDQLAALPTFVKNQ